MDSGKRKQHWVLGGPFQQLCFCPLLKCCSWEFICIEFHQLVMEHTLPQLILMPRPILTITFYLSICSYLPYCNFLVLCIYSLQHFSDAIIQHCFHKHLPDSHCTPSMAAVYSGQGRSDGRSGQARLQQTQPPMNHWGFKNILKLFQKNKRISRPEHTRYMTMLLTHRY